MVVHKPLEPREGEPRQPNMDYKGLLGTVWAYKTLLGCLGSNLAYMTLRLHPDPQSVYKNQPLWLFITGLGVTMGGFWAPSKSG